MRSRNHSCDQCRKSKRACDAPPLTYYLQDVDSLVCFDNPLSPAPRVRPCSYCAKTKKACTVNWAWSHLRISKAMEAVSSGGLQPDSAGSAKRQKLDTPSSQPIGESSPMNPTSDTMRSNLQDLPPPWSLYDETISEGDGIFGSTPNIDEALWTGPIDTAILEEGISIDYPSRRSEESFLSSFSFISGTVDAQPPLLSPVDVGLDINDWHGSQRQPLPLYSSHSACLEDSTKRKSKKRRLTGRTWPRETANSLSAFSIDQSMMARSNQGMISQSLLCIYHDVLEHNLSCWLTEVTCPYQLNGEFSQRQGSMSEWGSSWSNRIYERTIKLDQAARSTKLIKISLSEDQACARALHFAIMAFATQWAQCSRRQREQYSPLSGSFDPENSEGAFDDLVEEFDRSLQWHFWSQAERALQEVSHIESFRVVCAETVLGLSQKPWQEEPLTASAFNSQNYGFEEDSLTSQIAQEISRDGPPIYLERAARKMHTLKFKFDSALKGGVLSHREGGAAAEAVKSMSQEDKTMVGLLYWLTIMFDTVSSSMNERPVVVPDQDSQHASCHGQEADDSYWQVELFIQDKLAAPCHTIRWPCTYEVAASAVTRSAPVKVLLYRHVSYLQNTLRRGQSAEKIEQVIQNATSLYRYWNLTYGAFFRDLVHNYNSVPGRIQSWFVCISAHWHLACLILADLINTVDQKDLGLKSSTQTRLRSRVVAKMQETSVKELSDLARVATPPSEETDFFRLPGFHPCVNEGTILTEPWTVILIRAFSRAAVWLLEDAENYGQYGLGALGGDGLSQTVQQAEYCIKGLWFLGKKSDMARRVADILTRSLSSLKN